MRPAVRPVRVRFLFTVTVTVTDDLSIEATVLS
ncbi:hypothetical protein QFZ75_002914 [Streptomyces sp. V3I8]|nr:hypothetical protein [Streptomyces sp. V3I8]